MDRHNRRNGLWFLTILLPCLALQGGSSSDPAAAVPGEGTNSNNDFLSTILEVEKALLKHPIDNDQNDLVVLENELNELIDRTLVQIRQTAIATIQERETVASHNRQVIERTIAELEIVLDAVHRKRQMEKTILDNETLLKEQVQQMEREEQEKIYNSIVETIHTVVNATDFTPPCLTASTAGRVVHQALESYADEEKDLLQARGTKIIQQFTSTTYEPPIARRDPLFRLGDYSRYMPIDVEEMLPPGWPDWTIPNIIPAHVWHALRWWTPTGTSSSTTSAPPQAILQPHVQPGQCWPSARPKVIIQLAAPAVLSAITIDHVSSAALVHRDDDDRSSAPKHFQVYSYGPISVVQGSTNGKNGLSFDRSSRKLLLEGKFDTSGGVSSVQSFAVKGAEEADNHGGGSCSTVVPTCDSGVTISAAIEVVVLSNWGNPDYTCLYRVRAHGNVV